MTNENQETHHYLIYMYQDWAHIVFRCRTRRDAVSIALKGHTSKYGFAYIIEAGSEQEAVDIAESDDPPMETWESVPQFGGGPWRTNR